MGRRLLIVALILAVLAPPGAGLVGMQGTQPFATPSVAMSEDGMSMHTADAAHHGHAMMDAHEHSAAECEDYCMNCMSHCFSTAIVSSPSTFPFSASEPHRLAAGATTDHAYLLFRPPILS